MSFLRFLGVVALLEWLFGLRKKDNGTAPPHGRSYDYGRENVYLDKVHSLQNHINELERQQDRCDMSSHKYDELQDLIDDLQDEVDEIDDYFDDT